MTRSAVTQRPEVIPWAISLATITAIAVLDGLDHPIPTVLTALAAISAGGGAGMSIPTLAAISAGGGAGMSIPTPRISGGSSIVSQLSDITAEIESAFATISANLSAEANVGSPADLSALQALANRIKAAAASLGGTPVTGTPVTGTPTTPVSTATPSSGLAPTTTGTPVTGTPTTPAHSTTVGTTAPADPTAPVAATHPLLG